MAIIVGIDGTGGGTFPGAARNARYDRDFANSFVKRIAGRGDPDRAYFRGPVTFGGGLMDAIAGGLQFVLHRQAAGVTEPVILTGYSRGAAGAVVVAKRLKERNIDVEALLLFDCVDRHIGIDAEVIPDNVGYVMHVVRDPRSKSRESFGNDGLRYRSPTVFPNAYSFLCTHGGMGGTPWQPEVGTPMTALIDEGFPDGKTTITYNEDARVSAQIWSFVQPFMREHGYI